MKRVTRKIGFFLLAGMVLLIPAWLGAQRRADDPLLKWMNGIAQQQLQQREDAVAAIHTVAEAEARKKVVREKLLQSIGGLPDYHGPLNARVVGHIQADGYVIEKVIYESLPHFYVTADLYRPNQPGRYPAVLVQAGHVQEGKPAEEKIAANLAMKGFVALAFDPIGQGEREETYDRLTSRPAAGWSVNEHSHSGAQAMLVGEGLARYFIWDAVRSLDYLDTRADVDSARIGAVGCSGGGALTAFIGGLDPRIKAAVPACYPSSYRLLYIVHGGPDAEMSFPQSIANGLDIADFMEMSAPTPWLIMETENDYFPAAGAKLVADEARRFFSLYGAEDKVDLFVGHGPHGTPLENREAIYKWMIRWLKNGQGDFHEQPIHVYTNFELRVTRTGHVEDLPGSRKVYQLLMDEYHAHRRPGTVLEMQSELRRLGISTEGPAPEVKVVDDTDAPEGHQQRVQFESEPGVVISGRLFIPNVSGKKPAVLLVADGSTFQFAQNLAKAGRVVLELTPRDSPGEVDANRLYIGNWYTNWRADQIGRSLAAMRAHDLLRGVDVLAARSDVDPASIRAAARGVKGFWLLYAAAVDKRISKVWVDKTPHSLRAAIERPMNDDLFSAVIPGFVLHWDTEDLIKAVGKRPLMWVDPTDWMDEVVPLGKPFEYRYALFGSAPAYREELEKIYFDEFIK
ncbi:MAG: acetylxylan esterase [Terriglobia bacterium]